MVLTMSEVQLDRYTKQDGEARKPDFLVSRSEKSALVSNQAAAHELRTALRTINNMQQAAAQAHALQRHQFLDSISDDVFAENVTFELSRRRLLQRRNSRSMDDLTSITESLKKAPKRPNSLKLKKRSSEGELQLPNIQKKSPMDSSTLKSMSSPRNTITKSVTSPKEIPTPPRRQRSNGKLTIPQHLSPNSDAASSCPNSPLSPRKKKSEKLDINVIPVTTSGRVRCSSFSNTSSSSEGLVRASSFRSTSPTNSTSLPSPRKLRAQVEKNIRSNLEASRQEAARKKRLLNGRDRNSWEDQIARGQIEKSDRLSSDSEEEVVVSPYSISSSMKISSASGTFEKQTGKQGLKAWMGKSAPRNSKKKSL